MWTLSEKITDIGFNKKKKISLHDHILTLLFLQYIFRPRYVLLLLMELYELQFPRRLFFYMESSNSESTVCDQRCEIGFLRVTQK